MLDHNEFYANGPEQKIVEGSGHRIRRNYFHNTYVGSWFDGDNTDVIIEDNRYEDITWQAIFYEISQLGIIRRNTIRRSETGLLISTSKRVEVYENVLEDNWRGIQYFLNCSALGGGKIGFDLAENITHDNTIRVGTRSGSYASLFSYQGICLPATVVPYANGSKSNLFQSNTYAVPVLGAPVWNWADMNQTWSQWRALPQDALGTVTVREP